MIHSSEKKRFVEYEKIHGGITNIVDDEYNEKDRMWMHKFNACLQK